MNSRKIQKNLRIVIFLNPKFELYDHVNQNKIYDLVQGVEQNMKLNSMKIFCFFKK